MVKTILQILYCEPKNDQSEDSIISREQKGEAVKGFLMRKSKKQVKQRYDGDW